MHTAEPLVHDPNYFKDEIVIEKPKRYMLPGIDKMPAELIQTRSN
jgi:hypothetical protein